MMASAASSFIARRVSHMYRVKSSTSRRKYLFSLGVAGMIDPQRSP
jgi:hypothetical protein